MNSTEPLDRDATAGTRYPRDPNRQPGAGVRAGLGELGGRVEVAVCPRADAVIALTAGLAKRLRDDRVDGGEIHIIPPGVNSTELAQPADDPLPDVPHPRVVFLGRLAEQKGVETLLARRV